MTGKYNPEELWFNTPDSASLCRGGGNGENHPSQMYAIRKYVKSGMSFLDYGMGSATTYEALIKDGWNLTRIVDGIYYLGLDIIPKNVAYCKERFPEGNFEVNPEIHKISQPDKSWDVVFSRHVVDHMNNFEDAMDEHCRVARQLVIAVFWVPMANGDEHDIKNIVDGPQDARKTYESEYTNSYSRKKVQEWINNNKDFEVVEWTEEVGIEVSGHDWVLVLRRKEVV